MFDIKEEKERRTNPAEEDKNTSSQISEGTPALRASLSEQMGEMMTKDRCQQSNKKLVCPRFLHRGPQKHKKSLVQKRGKENKMIKVTDISFWVPTPSDDDEDLYNKPSEEEAWRKEEMSVWPCTVEPTGSLQ